MRGSKGSKVLRTRKIKINDNGYPTVGTNTFVVMGCYNDFANKHVEQIIRIAPRTEPLETPIEDPKKDKMYIWFYSYTRTEITKIDNETM